MVVEHTDCRLQKTRGIGYLNMFVIVVIDWL